MFCWICDGKLRLIYTSISTLEKEAQRINVTPGNIQMQYEKHERDIVLHPLLKPNPFPGSIDATLGVGISIATYLPDVVCSPRLVKAKWALIGCLLYGL